MKFLAKSSQVLLFTVLSLSLFAQSGQASYSPTIHTRYWSREDIFVEQVEASFLNNEGKRSFPILYQDSVYIPLRNAGEWLGAEVSQEGDTVFLRTHKDPFYLDMRTHEGQPDQTEEEFQQYRDDIANGIDVQLYPELTISLDDQVLSFVNAKGDPLVPILFRENIYLPVRSIGELMGKKVLWVPGSITPLRYSQVWIYDQPTAEQIQEMQQYFSTCKTIHSELVAEIEALNAFGPADAKNIGQCLRRLSSLSASLSDLPVPTTPFFRGHFIVTTRFAAFELCQQLDAYLYIHENRADRSWNDNREGFVSWLSMRAEQFARDIQLEEAFLNLMLD